MKQKNIFSIITIILSVSFLVYLFILRRPAKEVHYHAGFLVYIDGRLQDLSPSKYMKTEPCLTNKVKHPPEDNQREKAHLHDGVGDVVHVHRNNALWGDLFKNIDFVFPASESISGYISGVRVADILAYPINPYDSVIIVSGDAEGVDPGLYITADHIKEIESRSETCGN